jgi:hypothetical protein
METGTGKTYVYLRTIFELNKRFGFAKFVIVVPSVAIKEGVYKSLQIHPGTLQRHVCWCAGRLLLYDSSKLGQVRNFATSATIQIMVVTVGAINKKEVNNLYKDSEKTWDNLSLFLSSHAVPPPTPPAVLSAFFVVVGSCTPLYAIEPAAKYRDLWRSAGAGRAASIVFGLPTDGRSRCAAGSARPKTLADQGQRNAFARRLASVS